MPGNRDRNKTTAGVTREQVEDLIDYIWAFDNNNYRKWFRIEVTKVY
jgi:hypothetical protein